MSKDSMERLDKLIKEGEGIIETLKHDIERFKQCLTCNDLDLCECDDTCEDENGMCKLYKPLT